jgi:hypothetical protein
MSQRELTVSYLVGFCVRLGRTDFSESAAALKMDPGIRSGTTKLPFSCDLGLLVTLSTWRQTVRRRTAHQKSAPAPSSVAVTTQLEWIHSEIPSCPLPPRAFAFQVPLDAVCLDQRPHRNPIMRPDLTSQEMAALLQILERVERAIDEAPVSSLRQLAELHDEPRSKVATAPTVDQPPNRFVERIAAAMMRVRVQEA